MAVTVTTAHLMVVALWGGVLACEGIIEYLPVRGIAKESAVAELHFRIDALLEGPLLVAVVVTGALALNGAPWTALLAVKVALGAVAIAANVYCVAVVVRRRMAVRGSDPSVAFARFTRVIHHVIHTFTPVGLAAAGLGFALG